MSVDQTVLVTTNADGGVSGTPIMFTQLAANGKGPVTVKAPMSSVGFRNLAGLGKPPIRGGKAVWNLDLKGSATERAVSNFPTVPLPLRVSAAYEFNGKRVSAQDIVGKTGHLKVTYTVKNITTRAQAVTFKNVFGQTQRQIVQAPIPMAASFSVTFPDTFTNLQTPGGSTNGNGNGTTAASWTLYLFDPLGGVKQSISYQAQVTNAVVPAASLSAAAIPPQSLKTLPTITEPNAPAVPTATIGGHLLSFQVAAQKKVQQIAAQAATVLNQLQAVAVPAAQNLSTKAAQVATDLTTLSVKESNLSTTAGDVSAQLAQRAADLSSIASLIATAQTGLASIPTSICATLSQIPVTPTGPVTPGPVVQAIQAFGASAACPPQLAAGAGYKILQFEVGVLEFLTVQRSAEVAATAQGALRLQALELNASASLAAASGSANGLSASAAQQAIAIANATVPPIKSGAPVPTQQVGGGAQVDAAVAQLDASITAAGTKVNNDYGYLLALDLRALESQLPAGDATGSTVKGTFLIVQSGALIYSIPGADNSSRSMHLATTIGVLALLLGATIGLALYRIRRGQASSLAPPPKKT